MKRKLLLSGILLIACLALLLCIPPARAASSSEIRDQIDSLEGEQQKLLEQMDKLEAQLTENTQQLEQMIQQKQTLDQQIVLLHRQIQNADDQIGAYAVLVADKQLELEKEEARLSELRLAYKQRIRAMEEAGKLSYWQILFESRSMIDFLDRLDMIQQIAQADRRRMEEIREAADSVAQIQDTLTAEKISLEQVRTELESTKVTLQEKSSQSEQMLVQLLEKGDEYEALLLRTEQKEEALLEEIAKLEDDFDDAVYQEWLATYVPPTTAPTAEETNPVISDSGWRTPVSGYRVSSPFGMRLHPVLGYYRMHSGVDMACPAGTPIYAARGGKVTVAAYSSSAGNYVQINHGDGYASVYMHMTQYVVSAGDFVAQGQLIGYVGNTGLSKGNHLHFGISYKGTYVNPMELLG